MQLLGPLLALSFDPPWPHPSSLGDLLLLQLSMQLYTFLAFSFSDFHVGATSVLLSISIFVGTLHGGGNKPIHSNAKQTILVRANIAPRYDFDSLLAFVFAVVMLILVALCSFHSHVLTQSFFVQGSVLNTCLFVYSMATPFFDLLQCGCIIWKHCFCRCKANHTS